MGGNDSFFFMKLFELLFWDIWCGDYYKIFGVWVECKGVIFELKYEFVYGVEILWFGII